MYLNVIVKLKVYLHTWGAIISVELYFFLTNYESMDGLFYVTTWHQPQVALTYSKRCVIFLNFFTFWASYRNYADFCNDGTKTMIGKTAGVWTQIKVVVPDCTNGHCILHWSALAGKNKQTKKTQFYLKSIWFFGSPWTPKIVESSADFLPWPLRKGLKDFTKCGFHASLCYIIPWHVEIGRKNNSGKTGHAAIFPEFLFIVNW